VRGQPKYRTVCCGVGTVSLEDGLAGGLEARGMFASYGAT
jgi:hypothetical protein